MMLRKLLELLPEVDKLLLTEQSWTYQAVREDDFIFDRIWIPIGERRIALHFHPTEADARLCWHPHAHPIAVISRGHYELFVAGTYGRFDACARIVVKGLFGYELRREAHHAVRIHAPTVSIVLFGAANDKTDEQPSDFDTAPALSILDMIPAAITRTKSRAAM